MLNRLFLNKQIYRFSTKFRVLDFSVFQQKNPDLSNINEQLEKSLVEDGFFYIINHGISKDDFNKYIKLQSQFFKNDEKFQLQQQDKSFLRGYIPFGQESGSTDYFEVKEAYSYGYQFDKDYVFQNNLEGQNVWPQNNEFQKEMLEIYDKFVGVSLNITECLSQLLKQDLVKMCEGGDKISLMRLFHYFPYKQSQQTKLSNIGSSPHTDWGFLTLIMQSHASVNAQQGIQVFKDDQWIDVPSIENALIVNGGDYLNLISNGKYISPLHRGIQDRYSYVFFYYPNYNAKLPSISSNQNLSLLINQQNNQNQDKDYLINTSFGEFIANKWKEVSKKQ